MSAEVQRKCTVCNTITNNHVMGVALCDQHWQIPMTQEHARSFMNKYGIGHT